LEQLRVAVCYQQLNVKVAGSHGGLSVGADGATAEALEELAHMRSLPNMTVIVPCDALEAKKATLAAAKHVGPVFLRLGRNAVPIITRPEDPFAIGEAKTLREGSERRTNVQRSEDVSLIACGSMVAQALAAAALLAKEGLAARVINLHTLKPLDKSTILKAAREIGAIVTAEEHSILGGLGSAVAEVVVQEHPVPMRFVGVMDRFGTSGDPADLFKAFGLMPEDIAQAARDVLRLKHSNFAKTPR